MASIARANPERTNRWLLIGAAVLAVVFGILVFAVLANVGGDDSKSNSSSSATGSQAVLVAKDTIAPNTKISADMFELTKASSLVPGAIAEPSVAIGKVTNSEILKGEQIAESRLGIVNGKNPGDLANLIPENKRGVAVTVDESKIVGGFVVPGDHVDVVAIFDQQNGSTQNSVTRVETILQNVEVLAVAQESLDALPANDAQGTPVATDQSQGVLGTRPKDTDPKPSAKTATLALSPDDVQKLIAAGAKGSIVLVLRPAGDDKPVDINELNLDNYGFLGPIPRP